MEGLNQQIMILLSTLIIFQALIFGLIFLRAVRNARNLRILVLYEAAYIVGYCFALFYLLQLYDIYLYVYFLLMPVFALFPVLIYFYILSITKGSLERNQCIHLLFPLLILLVNIPYIFLLDSSTMKEILIDNREPVNPDTVRHSFYVINQILIRALLGVQPFVYLVLSIYRIREFRKRMQEFYSNLDRINLRWAVKVAVVFSVLYTARYVIGSDIYLLFSVLVINVYLGLEAVYYSNVYVKLHVSDEVPLNEELDKPAKDRVIDREAMENIRKAILNYMVEEKPYLHPNFSLMELSRAIGVNRQYASIVINEVFGKNFNNFVNHYRIRWFLDHRHTLSQFSIEGAIKQCGFNSKSSFYSAFKRETGRTPRQMFNH